jgi:hypothetical protein
VDFNEVGIIGAAIGVVIGVILEGWEHWDDFRKNGWAPVAPKIGFGILVISLAIEIVFDARLAKESADVQLETARIEKAYGPRRLTRDQLVALANHALPYAGTKAVFTIFTNDVESAFFSEQIGSALKAAHWQVSGGVMGGFAAPKTGVYVNSTDDERSVAGAAVIVTQLKQDGFDVHLGPTDPPNGQFGHRTGLTWIEVNPKPLALLESQREK